MKELGFTEVRAEVRELNDQDSFLLAIKMNQIHSKGLSALEEGVHLIKMREKFGWTQSILAEKMRRSQSWVSQRISLVEDSSKELIFLVNILDI